jgi:hypothetical protein
MGRDRIETAQAHHDDRNRDNHSRREVDGSDGHDPLSQQRSHGKRGFKATIPGSDRTCSQSPGK